MSRTQARVFLTVIPAQAGIRCRTFPVVANTFVRCRHWIPACAEALLQQRSWSMTSKSVASWRTGGFCV
jgi:hypothetical protein